MKKIKNFIIFFIIFVIFYFNNFFFYKNIKKLENNNLNSAIIYYKFPSYKIKFQKTLNSYFFTYLQKKYPHVSASDAKKIVNEVVKTDIPILLFSLIAIESSFRKNLKSSKNAVGLGQIIFKYHKNMLKKINIHTEKDLFKIEKNIKASEKILKKYIYDCGNVFNGLIKYNSGKCNFKKSEKYALKILKLYSNISYKVRKELLEEIN